MLKSLLRDRLLLVLLSLAIMVKLFSLNEGWVERYYTYGFYPVISTLLRFLLGWIPFSLGDIAYAAAFVFLLAKLFKLIYLLSRQKIKQYLGWFLLRKYLRLALWIYLAFNMTWGLNYNRRGIASQLGLQVEHYSTQDLVRLTTLLEQRLNFYADQEDSVKRLALNDRSRLFSEGVKNYDSLSEQYDFLHYIFPSIKPSLYSRVGHYFGFSGYFNPFTSEAQLNTTEPVFTKPFVIDHELAHQLGYAKENEASFVSYLACRQSSNIDFRYSVYYELFFDALYECASTGDSALVGSLRRGIHPRVVQDRLDEKNYRLRRKNRLQPYISDFYNSYLKFNNQPKGLETYNEVTAWLIGYMKKYGEEKL